MRKISQHLLDTPTWISILLGSILCFWQFFLGEIPPTIQLLFFIFLLAITGIPHGAIDHLVEEETANRTQKPFQLWLFLLKYLLTMLVYGMIWFFFPSLSLLFFLVISAWHFGETDLDKAPSTFLWNTARFLLGCFVLLCLLFLHAEATLPIIERIVGGSKMPLMIWDFGQRNGSVILIFLFFLVSIFSFFANLKAKISIEKIRYLRLFLILTLCAWLPLLPAFALYFGGWHALCSFDNIIQYLDKNDNNDNKKRFYIQIWSKTLLFTSVAVAFLAFATWYWLHYLNTWDPIPLLFIFLSLITLPHLNVMHQMSKKNIA